MLLLLNSTPPELLNLDHFPEDLSILIGENGSGKSTMLNKLSQHFLTKQNKYEHLGNKDCTSHCEGIRNLLSHKRLTHKKVNRK